MGAALASIFLSLCATAQNLPGYMSVKEGWFTDGAKVVLDGQIYRPSSAADLCEECWEARDHFDHARRLRVRSFILANLGLAETVVGALRLEDARAVGTAHAAVGGVFMTWAAEREAKVRQHDVAVQPQQNVLRLKISIDHVIHMQIGKSCGELRRVESD